MNRSAHAVLAVAALLASVALAQPADPYAEALKYEHGQPRAALMTIEAQIRQTATPAARQAIETRLLALLASPTATADARDWACRQLRQVGSARAVPALAPLLADPALSTTARWALQSIAGPEAGAALRDALGRVEGSLQTGIAQSLGARRDRESVPLLAELAGSTDPAVAESALHALGQIGGVEALRALEAAKVTAAIEPHRAHALVRAAESVAAEGAGDQAAAVLAALVEQAEEDTVKLAALRGWLRIDPSKASTALAAMLRAERPQERRAAAQALVELGQPVLLQPILAELGTLPADVQTTLLGLVRGPEALPAVRAALTSDVPEVRTAAIEALGRVGDASAVAGLLELAGGDDPALRAAARQSLRQLADAQVNVALMAAARTGAAAERSEAIAALADRQAREALPLLVELARSDPAVRRAALGALGALATADTLGDLVSLLASPESDRAAAEQALAAASRRMTPDQAAATLTASLAQSAPPVRAAMLRVLAGVPADASLAALQAALADAEPAVRDAALRGLAGWPDARPAAALLAAARASDNAVQKVLALRGLFRMAALDDGRPAESKVGLVADGLAVASRPEEKKLALAALGELDHPAALALALACAADPATEVEAAAALVKIARRVQKTDPAAAGEAVRKLQATVRSPEAQQLAASAGVVLDGMVNIAPQGTATSPDELEKDGTAGGDQAAIDGDLDTYWDEVDGQPLYRLVVALPRPEKVLAVSLVGYGHHNFAPRAFEILGDGKPVKKVDNAQYEDNFLVVGLEGVACSTIELRITAAYSGSPAIRELGIYRAAP